MSSEEEGLMGFGLLEKEGVFSVAWNVTMLI